MCLQNPCEVPELIIYVASLVHLIYMLKLEGVLIFVNIVLRIFVYRIVPHRLYYVISCNLSIYNKVSVVLYKTHGLFKCLLAFRILTWYLEPTKRKFFAVFYPVDLLSSGEKFPSANRVITPV